MKLEVPRINTAAELAQIIERAIRSGVHKPGERLPSERKLASTYGVTRHLVRGALDILAADGCARIGTGRDRLVTRMPRKGQKQSLGRLRCINVLEALWPRAAALSFVDAAILEGYTAALDPYDIRFRILRFDASSRHYEGLLHPAIDAAEQGVIIRKTPGLTKEVLVWLSERQVPHVVVSHCPYRRDDLPAHHSVFVNRWGAAFHAVVHLTELGHERIAFLGDAPEHNGHSMYPGYEAAFHAMGRPVDLQWVKDCSHTESDEVRETAIEWMRSPDRPSAVVCYNDTVAIGVIGAAKQAGLRIPRDLSVVGYDNMPGVADLDPPLSTFENRERELGLEAVHVLKDVCEGSEGPPRLCRLSCPMVVRGSTAPPARTHSLSK